MWEQKRLMHKIELYVLFNKYQRRREEKIVLGRG